MEHKVFVYGSLKRGYGNNSLLGGARFQGKAVSCGTYQFISLGAFPAIINKPEHDNQWRVAGEVYSCDDSTLARLDMLESNGSMYQRFRRPVELPDGSFTMAWAYEFLMEPWHHAGEAGESNAFDVDNDVASWNPRHR